MTKEEIKSTTSMREVLERYGLIPNACGYIPCPFHQERTASMKIYEKDYNCFGCGANGDIFSFIQEMEGISFSEAFRSLGGTYELESPRMVKIRQSMARQEKIRRAEEEYQFLSWRRKRLNETCRLLRLLDVVIPVYKPYSDEWEAAIRMRESNRYRYTILASGKRVEQEEMRTLDG